MRSSRITFVFVWVVFSGLTFSQKATAEGVITELFNSLKEKIAFYSQQARVGDLKVGDEAPDFSLSSVDGKTTIQLSSFEGKQDVVLIFGSYT